MLTSNQLLKYPLKIPVKTGEKQTSFMSFISIRTLHSQLRMVFCLLLLVFGAITPDFMNTKFYIQIEITIGIYVVWWVFIDSNGIHGSIDHKTRHNMLYRIR